MTFPRGPRQSEEARAGRFLSNAVPYGIRSAVILAEGGNPRSLEPVRKDGRLPTPAHPGGAHMNALAKAFANHRAVYDERERLGRTGQEDAYDELVLKSDRLLMKLAKAPCANDEEFIAKLAHIAEVEIKDSGEPEGQNFESTVVAVRSYLAQPGRSRAGRGRGGA